MPLSNLNSEQLQAATAPLGHNLIIASAGTGKTSTIVGRIAHLLSSGIYPQEILLLTFTNKAAAEMVQRLGRYFDSDKISKIEAGTFHAVSYRWLKKYDKVVLKQPSELKTLFRSIYEKRNFTRYKSNMQPFSSSFLFDMYSLYQNSSLEGFDTWFLDRYEEHESLIDIYVDMFDEYEKTKDEFGFVTFNDLLIKMKKLVGRVDMPFVEILVDEYQDTNTLQESVIDTIKPKSLFCVGDFDQSIYAFNGANIDNIGTFNVRHPAASVFTLKKNYRSTKHILSLANQVISNNERIYKKELEVVRNEEAKSPKLLIYDELFGQYQAIAHKIKISMVEHEQIAVIFRNNASADGVEASLRELEINCKRKGGVSFFDSKEVKVVLNMLSLMSNPKDMMSFIHIFEYARGIGSASAKEFFESFIHFGKGDFMQGVIKPLQNSLPQKKRIKNVQLALFEEEIGFGSVTKFAKMGLGQKILSHPILKHPKLSTESVHFVEGFYELSKKLSTIKRARTAVEAVINSPLFASIFEDIAKKRAMLKTGQIDEEKKAIALDRIKRKVTLLLDLSKHYDTMEKFVNAMVLGGGELSEGVGVNLLTVHASKGLEFKQVFLIDMMDGRFPNRKLIEKTGSLDEERRLFYVAVTRAKDELFLSFAKYDRIKQISFKPSQFLYEAGLLQKDETYRELMARAESKED